MISFIVPAHNEEGCLDRTLEAIHESAAAVGQPYEIIVVDDASTDSTAEIARQHGATVVAVNHRQIAATRNSGGRAAGGERLFFVDADTIINPRAAAAALRSMDNGAVGGGAPARFDATAPLYGQLLIWYLGWFLRLAGIAGGAFMFCRAEAFQAVGGFDEKLFGAEDAAMSWALKREGRFVVLWQYVVTSGRRLRGLRGLQTLAGLIRMGFFPKMLTRRSSVQKIWYDSNREKVDNVPDSLTTRLFNGIMLLITILCVGGPLWNLVPWSLTPRDTWLGKIRLGGAIFTCHIALVLWPCSYFLLRGIWRQKQWTERINFAALMVLSLALAWGGTKVVVWFWSGIYHRLT